MKKVTKQCQICGEPSVARFQRQDLCAKHLNPPPTVEYLWRERLRWAAGQSYMCAVEDSNPGAPSFTSKERRGLGL